MKILLLVVLVLWTGSEAGSNDTLSFIVIGDNGGHDYSPYYDIIETSVANMIAQIAVDKSVDFILELGDNFYEDGVTNVHDHRFRDTFENVFHHSSLQIPWYIIAGNHDHRGNVTAQIEYSKISHRWNFPYYYYPLTFKIPGGGTIDLVMMDTTVLCGHSVDEVELNLTGPWDLHLADVQWYFITSMLQQSNATYLWTVGHYPVYSIGAAGPTPCLKDKLLPLMEKYNVSGHMCGHEHNLQHLQTSTNGHTMDFLVSGCADKLDKDWSHTKSVPTGSLKFKWADTHAHGGFVLVEVKSSSMTSTFIDSTGKVLHRVTTLPRRV